MGKNAWAMPNYTTSGIANRPNRPIQLPEDLGGAFERDFLAGDVPEVPDGIAFTDQGIPLLDQIPVMRPDVGVGSHSRIEDPDMPKMGVADEMMAMIDADQLGRHLGPPDTVGGLVFI